MADPIAPPALADQLRDRTTDLHRQAERTGIVADILKGQADRIGYTLFLRNLMPVYEALEHGLARHRDKPQFAAFAKPELFRKQALMLDLMALAGPGFHAQFPLLATSKAYAAAIASAAEGQGERLLAHAYVRYLGDLSGGQILKRLLMRSLQLHETELSFYEFPNLGDLGAYKTIFRQALDAFELTPQELHRVVDEGALAFELAIAMSQDVKQTADATQV